MNEPARVPEPAAEPAPSDPNDRVVVAGRRALNTIFGAQQLMFEEAIFTANELLDRTRTETHLFAEFASKLAGSHSVRDWETMYRECGQHQIDFIRRDCDRLFRHGARAIEAAFGLLNGRPPRSEIAADVQSDAHKNDQP